MLHLWKNQVDGFSSKMCEEHLWKSDILSKDAGEIAQNKKKTLKLN